MRGRGLNTYHVALKRVSKQEVFLGVLEIHPRNLTSIDVVVCKGIFVAIEK